MLTEPIQCDAHAEGKTDSVNWLLTTLERGEAEGFLTTDEFVLAGGGLTGRVGSMELRWRERNVPSWVTLTFYRLDDGRLCVTRDDENDLYYLMKPEFGETLDIHPIQSPRLCGE